MKIALIVVGIAVVMVEHGHALSCICGASPCETPACCPSGMLTGDACACCQVCAKNVNEVCGGPWRTSGTCGAGASCLRHCRCQTVDNKNCIFPFNYQGKTYYSCTTDNSENGRPWCATEVDPDGNVIEKKWGDCSDNCAPCTEGDLFNFEGHCVSEKIKQRILEDTSGNGRVALPFVHQFDDGVQPSELDDKTKVPKCITDDSGSVVPTGCRCTSEIARGSEGHCQPPQGPLETGWCFLEHVENPNSPTENCFGDAQWSASAGRFWSSEACKPSDRVSFDSEGY